MMGALVAGRGARERGDRRLEVKVDSIEGGLYSETAMRDSTDDDDVYYPRGRRPREDK